MEKTANHMNRIIAQTGVLFALLMASSCGDKPPAMPAAPPPVPVSLYTAATGNATYFDSYPATVTPLNQVDIRPQVSGNIIGIFFADGQHVSRGQKLYQIDQQQYRGAYEQAEANLNVAKANLAKAQQDADRYQELAKQDAIARQTLEHQLADLESARRQVEAAAANVSSVQTNLKYSVITAPFEGTIGISQVKIGTAVYPQTLLNTISSDDPMAVDISIDQADIPLFTAYLQPKPALKDSTFSLVMTDGSIYPYPGHLSLLDRAADPQTGTIKARLVFPNPKKLLRPGVTTNIRMRHNSGEASLLIPYKAVVEQLGEYYVYVVGENKRATQHKISLGTKINDRIVVKTGLQPGEQIVVEGVQKLRDSALVQVGPPKPPAK